MCKDEKRQKMHSIWEGIKKRCLQRGCKGFKNYGGRGVTICDEWKKFENFYKDMEETFLPNLTIDRLDGSGNYCKNNCRWATMKEQSINRKTTKWIELDGKKWTIDALARKFGLTYTALWGRLYLQKLSVHDALSTPPKPKSIIFFRGRRTSLRKIAQEEGINYRTFLKRLRSQRMRRTGKDKKGDDIEKALIKPVRPARKYKFNGTELTLRDLSIKTNFPRQLIESRVKQGWSVEKAVNTKKRVARKFFLEGENLTLKELSEKYKINYYTLKKRIRQCKWPVRQAVFTPIRVWKKGVGV